MSYDYNAAIKAGAKPEDVLTYLAKQQGYDSSAAVKAGASTMDVIKYLSTKSAQGPVAASNPYNATFRASTNENPLAAGAKAIGNLPSSFINFAKSLGGAVIHPIDTLSGIGKVALGGTVAKIIPGQQPEEQVFNQFVSSLKDRYGSLGNLQKTATEDPFGFGADVLSLIEGGGALVGKGAQVENILSKTAQAITKPVELAATKTAETAGNITKFAASQATGLNPETITELVKNPEAFKNINPEQRIQTAGAVKDALDSRIAELQDTGTGYKTIRETPGSVTIPENTITKVFDKFGIKLDEVGKIVTSPESRPLSSADKSGLQSFLDNYGTQKVLSNNAYLNTREALSQLASYGEGKTSVSTAVARDLRSAYDSIGKEQISGLKALDAEYAPERELINNLKKDIFTAQGDLKDGAISKIANVTGKGKEKLLARVKEVVPDIEQRVKVIKAVEDIEKASGFKVGTYSRGSAVGIGAVTGNVPLIVSAILTHPEIATQILRGAGYIGKGIIPILQTIKSIVNDINNFRIPKILVDEQGNLKAGMSIKDITRSIHPEDLKELRDFTDYVSGSYKPKTTQIETDARRIGVRYGLISEAQAKTIGNKALSSAITKSGIFKKG